MLGRGCKEAFLPQRARREKDLAPCVISALLPCRYPHGHNDRESGRRRGKGSRRVSQPSVFLLSLRLREVLLLLRFQQHTVGAAQFDIHTVIIFSAGQHHKRVGKRNDTGDQQKRKGAFGLTGLQELIQADMEASGVYHGGESQQNQNEV